MSRIEKSSSSFQCSRRSFFVSCATAAAGLTALSMFGSQGSLLADSSTNPKEKARIKIIFAHPDPTKPNWPNIDYDFEGHIKEISARFKEKCPWVEFLTVTVSSGEKEEALKILEGDKGMDGYLVYLAGCLWGEITETVAASGKPTIIMDHLFAGSGEFLTSYAAARRAGNKVIAVSSSRFEDAVDAVKCISALKELAQSRVLVVGREADQVAAQVYGTTMSEVDFQEINGIYETIKPAESKAVAERWISEAAKVIEPSSKEVEKAAAMYLSMKALMKKNNADAITINCLGGIYSGRMVEAYPCLGFMELDNQGLVGACEADQRSTITKLLMTYLIGRPGFISDPVIDTATNRIIYAHCVAPTKVYGPDGPASPYHLRDHSEDHKGACNRSLMPLGEMTTTIMFDHNKKQVIFHQGKTVENVDDHKACRNKLAVEVKGDIYKLLNYWDEWGWHRVTFYGNHKRQVFDVAALLGFQVVEEA